MCIRVCVCLHVGVGSRGDGVRVAVFKHGGSCMCEGVHVRDVCRSITADLQGINPTGADPMQPNRVAYQNSYILA